MQTIRQISEDREREYLSPFASQGAASQGRRTLEEPCPIRTVYQVDRDRILHSKSFRRLKHKTQVFLAPEGDHYRTRLTHTLEVSQIARTIARALFLNEDLVEAIALGHDLGHTPFGHSGERALNELLPEGFHHVRQSLRVVDILEKDGAGLNLSWEVRNGIAKHSKGGGKIFSADRESLPSTLEGMVVRISDVVAYVNHDLDDAIRSGIVTSKDLPDPLRDYLGESSSGRINKMVTDVIMASKVSSGAAICMSSEMESAVEEFKAWLNLNVYRSEKIEQDFLKASKIIEELYNLYLLKPEEMGHPESVKCRDSNEVLVADFISGMTDRFAVSLFQQHWLPSPWKE